MLTTKIVRAAIKQAVSEYNANVFGTWSDKRPAGGMYVVFRVSRISVCNITDLATRANKILNSNIVHTTTSRNNYYLRATVV